MVVNTVAVFLLVMVTTMVKIYCDACGKDTNDGMNNEYAHLSANQGSWGYNSPWDMWAMNYQICVQCTILALDAIGLNPDSEPEELNDQDNEDDKPSPGWDAS